MENLNNIFRTLGFNKQNGLYITSDNIWEKECRFSKRIQKLIVNKIKPDAFFSFDNKPLILFYDSPSNVPAIHKSVWNFNESPVIIIAYKDRVDIFNGFKYEHDLEKLELFGNEDKLDLFAYFQLVTGKTWELYQSELKHENRVDFYLLKNIRAAREIMLQVLITSYDGLVPSLDVKKKCMELSNALIGKIIFIRYLIDRKVNIGFEGDARYWTNDDLIELLQDRVKTIRFFQYLEEKFNGDMFFISDDEYKLINTDCLNILIKLLNEEELETGQMSLFRLYDFSIIPIEFVSNVYESFIGVDNQANEGAYYTPLFLVDYILKETVERTFEKDAKQYRCRVLDPACGSGVFLVETLRKIIEQYIEIHPDIDNDIEKFKVVLHDLAKDNIFGIDKNLSAIQVAIFSIHLILLDYQSPSSIENFKFPKLLNRNFFEADFFDTGHEYNDRFKEISFDYIIGNPPWRRGSKAEKPLYVQYVADRKRKEKKKGALQKEITISNKEVAQAFLLRVSDFSVKNNCAFIVTSKILYNLNGKEFRGYFLENYNINRIFELSAVRHEVFDKSTDKAIAPASIIFYKYRENEKQSTDANIIEHISLKPSRFFSLFKIFSINRNDYKQINQKKLKEFDWLWKTLVYGSYLDFNLIQRLMSMYPKIQDQVLGNNDYFVKQGLKIKDGAKKNNVESLKGLPYINTTKIITPFFIKPIYETFSEDYVGYIYKKDNVPFTELFNPPILLMTGGITNEFKIKTAISYDKVVFKSSLTGIKTCSKNINTLKAINAILYSSFISYYILQTASSAGIEREELHDKEKWAIPFSTKDSVIKIVNKIEKKQKERYEKKINVSSNEYDSKLLNDLNDQILDSFDFSDQEKSLLDYGNSVMIPMIMKNDYSQRLYQTFEYLDAELEEYAQLYLNRFKLSLDNESQTFQVEIWYTEYYLGMFFKVVAKDKAGVSDIIWLDKSDENILSLLIRLSSDKITDQLFVQKDIRGFEKDSFYIFKPNEKRLWHKAIGYLDVNEFADAILKTGRGDDE